MPALRRLAHTNGLQAELGSVDAEFGHVADAIAKVGLSDTLTAKLAELEARKRSLARNSLQALFGIVKVDRWSKDYADLAIGVPIHTVAGARFGTLQVVFDLAA